jgi:antitoxin component HigA of HigAB toxin-antitoxin module
MTEDQHKRALEIIDHLMDIEESDLTEEEARVMTLLAELVEEYEQKAFPLVEQESE